MKFSPLLSLLLLLMTTSLQAQNILTDTVYKKGIYRNFEEFKTNSPSIEMNHAVKSNSSPMPMNDWTSYSIDIPKDDSKAIGPVYGFCNGHSIYVTSGKPEEMHKPAFEQVLYVGPYSFYQDQGGLSVMPVMTPGGMGVGMTTGSMPIYDKIINMKTGEVTILTNGTLKKMMADNPQLLSEFKKDSKKEFRRMKYLKRYLEAKASVPPSQN